MSVAASESDRANTTAAVCHGSVSRAIRKDLCKKRTADTAVAPDNELNEALAADYQSSGRGREMLRILNDMFEVIESTDDESS